MVMATLKLKLPDPKLICSSVALGVLLYAFQNTRQRNLCRFVQRGLRMQGSSPRMLKGK